MFTAAVESQSRHQPRCSQDLQFNCCLANNLTAGPAPLSLVNSPTDYIVTHSSLLHYTIFTFVFLYINIYIYCNQVIYVYLYVNKCRAS